MHADAISSQEVEKGVIERGEEEKPKKKILYLSFAVYDFANYLEDVWLENFAIYENCNYNRTGSRNEYVHKIKVRCKWNVLISSHVMRHIQPTGNAMLMTFHN